MLESSFTSSKPCPKASEPWTPGCAIGLLSQPCHPRAAGYCHALMRAPPRPWASDMCLDVRQLLLAASHVDPSTARPYAGCLAFPT